LLTCSWVIGTRHPSRSLASSQPEGEGGMTVLEMGMVISSSKSEDLDCEQSPLDMLKLLYPLASMKGG